jgi:hypothetical protein
MVSRAPTPLNEFFRSHTRPAGEAANPTTFRLDDQNLNPEIPPKKKKIKIIHSLATYFPGTPSNPQNTFSISRRWPDFAD